MATMKVQGRKVSVVSKGREDSICSNLKTSIRVKECAQHCARRAAEKRKKVTGTLGLSMSRWMLASRNQFFFAPFLSRQRKCTPKKAAPADRGLD